jgi:hypothetical protein
LASLKFAEYGTNGRWLGLISSQHLIVSPRKKKKAKQQNIRVREQRFPCQRSPSTDEKSNRA